MIIGASMFFQSEEDLSRLINFKGLKLQLSFMKVKYLKLFLDRNYINELRKLNIEITSIHAPSPRIADGLSSVLKKCQSLIPPVTGSSCKITVHPQRSPIPDRYDLEHLSAWAQKERIKICWEMFPTKRGEWARTPFELNTLANQYRNFSITYDTSHVDDEYWLHPLTWRYIQDNVSIIHLSVKPKMPILMGFKEPIDVKHPKQMYIREHCYMDYESPAYDYNSFLKTVKQSNWNGMIILEYMPHYDDRMIDDVEKITKFFAK